MSIVQTMLQTKSVLQIHVQLSMLQVHVHTACPCPCRMSMSMLHVYVNVHLHIYRNVGMPDCPASGQTGTNGKRQLPLVCCKRKTENENMFSLVGNYPIYAHLRICCLGCYSLQCVLKYLQKFLMLLFRCSAKCPPRIVFFSTATFYLFAEFSAIWELCLQL
jgi:hypothetical protein